MVGYGCDDFWYFFPCTIMNKYLWIHCDEQSIKFEISFITLQTSRHAHTEIRLRRCAICCSKKILAKKIEIKSTQNVYEKHWNTEIVEEKYIHINYYDDAHYWRAFLNINYYWRFSTLMLLPFLPLLIRWSWSLYEIKTFTVRSAQCTHMWTLAMIYIIRNLNYIPLHATIDFVRLWSSSQRLSSICCFVSASRHWKHVNQLQKGQN